jgi:hypothetical protein
VLRLADWGVVRRLYGQAPEPFHNASLAWHSNSSYVFVGAQGLGLRGWGCAAGAARRCNSAAAFLPVSGCHQSCCVQCN